MYFIPRKFYLRKLKTVGVTTKRSGVLKYRKTEFSTHDVNNHYFIHTLKTFFKLWWLTATHNNKMIVPPQQTTGSGGSNRASIIIAGMDGLHSEIFIFTRLVRWQKKRKQSFERWMNTVSPTSWIPYVNLLQILSFYEKLTQNWFTVEFGRPQRRQKIHPYPHKQPSTEKVIWSLYTETTHEKK